MSATPSEATPTKDEAQIRELFETWRSALAAKDLDQMLVHYAPDVLFFDVTPPYQHKGAAAYRGSWEACFPYLPARIGTEIRDLEITANGDLAFAHCLNRIMDLDTGKPATCNWVRVTVCYQRIQGQWKVVHEHVSVPFDPMTSKAAFINEP